MRRTFKIKFYCRQSRARKDGTAPVEISIIVDGGREIFSLPRSCKPEDFPTPDLKIYCHGVENKINEIYTALSVADEPISAFILKDIYLNGNRRTSYTLKQMFDDGLALKRSQGVEPETYAKYKLTIQHFYDALKMQPAREAGSVTHGDILLFQAAMDAEYKPHTVRKIMMRLKYFFLLAFNSGKIRANPFAGIKPRKVESSVTYLTQEEVGAIRSLPLEGTLARVRDTFLFMCYSGLEYADVAALTPEDFQEKDNLIYIKKARVKTGIEYVSVLYGDALEIRKIYGGKIPLLSNQKMNVFLKVIASSAGITKNVSTLTARHTYGTYLLGIGLSLDVVSKMLGHNSSQQTRVYAELLDDAVLAANAGVKDTSGVTIPPAAYKPAREPDLALPEDDLEAFKMLLGI